jgi:hypothetical protein
VTLRKTARRRADETVPPQQRELLAQRALGKCTAEPVRRCARCQLTLP